jgi:hypothetical protein
MFYIYLNNFSFAYINFRQEQAFWGKTQSNFLKQPMSSIGLLIG